MSKSVYLQGFAWDEKSSYLRGPRLAPPLIRQYLWSDSSNRFSEMGEDITPPRLIDEGDTTPSAYFDMEGYTEQKLGLSGPLITLGGDHSITYPVIKAFSKKYPKLDILHIDAHTDLYAEFEGDPHSHACPFARIMEGEHAQRLVQVGIRTLTPHQQEQADKYGVEILQMKDQATWQLPKFDNPVYLSLDLDGIDPAFAPGVSHHEPGGLSTRQVLDIIHQLDAELVGADVVEYNPEQDVQGITGALAAKMVKEIAGKLLSQ